MSLLAPFFSSTSVASTLLTAAAQWRADLPAGKPNNFSNKPRSYFLKHQDGQSTLREESNCSAAHSMWTCPEVMLTLWKSPCCGIPLCYQDAVGLLALALGCFYFYFLNNLSTESCLQSRKSQHIQPHISSASLPGLSSQATVQQPAVYYWWEVFCGGAYCLI